MTPLPHNFCRPPSRCDIIFEQPLLHNTTFWNIKTLFEIIINESKVMWFTAIKNHGTKTHTEMQYFYQTVTNISVKRCFPANSKASNVIRVLVLKSYHMIGKKQYTLYNLRPSLATYFGIRWLDCCISNL